MKKLLRRIRKSLGIWTTNEIKTTYSNAFAKGYYLNRKVDKDEVVNNEVIKTGTTYLVEWVDVYRKY